MKAYVSIEARAVCKQHITLAHVNDAVRSQYMHYSQALIVYLQLSTL